MSSSSMTLTTGMNTVPNDGLTNQRTRVVHFSHAIITSHVTKVSKEEAQAVWFTESDYANIQMGILKTVKRSRKDKVNEKRYCTRGLEHIMTSSHMEQSKKDKEALRDRVLSEQSKQRQSGIHDPINIRKVSLAHSKRSRELALQLGASDAIACTPRKERL